MHVVSGQGSEAATVGGGGKLVTRDGKTHVVWQDLASAVTYKAGGGNVPRSHGYLNRVRTFDHATGEFSEPVTLNKGVDNHARPNICMDHDGILHVVISGHNTAVTYRRSLKPNDSSAWTEPVVIDKGTYPVPVCGPDNSVYLVMRSAEGWNGVNFYVKPPDRPWRKQAHLVRRDPDMPGDAAFHSGLAVASDGTIHAVIDFYEGKGIYEKRGLHQAVCTMRSGDGGKAWTRADGTPIPLPARPEQMDVLARDTATERHLPLAPPVVLAMGSIVLDRQERPHVLFIDHRRGPGQLVHATPDDQGTWTRTDIDAITRAFPKHRPTSVRGSFGVLADGTLVALLQLVPLGDGWRNGLPTRALRSDPRIERPLARLTSRDNGATWTATPAVQDHRCYGTNLERPTGGNTVSADRLPPFVYFTGIRRYLEEGEMVNNTVYLAVPETVD
ncbi:MAG: BNR-4 repeat-containing protein [Planctomycetota bacterium]